MSSLICFGAATAVTPSNNHVSTHQQIDHVYSINYSFQSSSTENRTTFLTLGGHELTQGSDELAVHLRRTATPRLPAQCSADDLLGLEHLIVLPVLSFELTQARLDPLLHLAVEPGAVALAEELEDHAHLLHLVHGRRRARPRRRPRRPPRRPRR
jgi:hypothetical protein